MAMERENRAPRGNSRKRRKVCQFCVDKATFIDYKDTAKLRRFMSERSKILPRRTTGEKGPEAQRVLALAREIAIKLNLKCETWDEWLTTVAAERVLLEGGVRREARREVVDKTAAAIILDGYLNYLAHGRKNEQDQQ